MDLEPLLRSINHLTERHMKSCPIYRDYVGSLFGVGIADSFEDVPYLPVIAFKGRELKSIPNESVFRRMSSSGTGLRGKSTIAIDRETARLQTRALAKSFSKFFGSNRFPMLIIDKPSSRDGFTAKQAGISGFSTFSRGTCFALGEDGSPNIRIVEEFIQTHGGKNLMVFGFTFLVWQFLDDLAKKGASWELSDSFLLHGGGWKKMQDRAVSKGQFTRQSIELLGISSVHNYYGMIEQTGTVYFECSYGFLHSPDDGTFLIRNPLTLAPVEDGKEGVIQVFSSIQQSYPGHSLLTEDLGISLGSDCECGFEGKRLAVIGRLSNSELRGCSDAT